MQLLVIFVRVKFFLEPGRAWVVPLCNRAKCYPVAQPDASVCGLRIGGRSVAQLDVPTQSVLRQCQYSLPIGDLNPNNKGHTRCIVIPFFEHSDKSNSTALYEELNTSETKSQHQWEKSTKDPNEKIFPHVSNVYTLTCSLQNDSVYVFLPWG